MRALLAIIMATACTRQVAIAPDSLAALERQNIEIVGSGLHDVPLPSRLVRTPDGRLVEIHGDSTIAVTAKGDTLEFAAPIAATVAGDRLAISGGNTSERTYLLASIERVETAVPDRKRTLWAAAGAGIAMGVATFFLVGATRGDE